MLKSVKTGLLIISIKKVCVYTSFKLTSNWCKSRVLHSSVYSLRILRAPVFDRCDLGVIHEIHTDFTLLLKEYYQRNPSDEHVFILTLCPPNAGKTKDTVFYMVQNKQENPTH